MDLAVLDEEGRCEKQTIVAQCEQNDVGAERRNDVDVQGSTAEEGCLPQSLAENKF
jgi:hypothetical protein